MRVLRNVKQVVSTVEGKEVTKNYTNFYIEVEIEGNLKLIPIQPVNFGEKQNRRNYQVLSLVATEIKKEDMPF